MIHGRDANRVNIVTFEQLAVILVARDVLADDLARLIHTGLGDVTDGDLLDVALARVALHAAHVGLALATHTDVGDVDSIVGANHPTRRRRLILPVNRGFDDV